MLLAEICPLLYQGLWIDIFLQNVRSCEANSFNFPQTHSSVQIVFPAMMHDYSCNRSFHVYIKDWSTIMEIKSPKYGTYRGHEGGDYTNILFPMGGGICNKVQLFHSSLCPRGGGGGGQHGNNDWSINFKIPAIIHHVPHKSVRAGSGKPIPW